MLLRQLKRFESQIIEMCDNSNEFIARVENKIVNANQQNKNSIRCTILQYKRQDSWIKCNKKTSINWGYSENTALEVDDIIHLRNIYIKKPIDTPKDWQETSYVHYLCKEGLLGTCSHPPDWILLKRPYFSISRIINQLKNSLYQRICNKINLKTSTLFSCIFWGKPASQVGTDVRIACGNWGLSHYLARSGLHLIIFFVGWMHLLRVIPINFQLKQLLLAIISLIYIILTGHSISFIRATLISFLSNFGRAFYQQNTLLHFICIVCLCILLWNPLQLFFLDFQLTFALTFALAFLAEQQYIHHKKDKNTYL